MRLVCLLNILSSLNKDIIIIIIIIKSAFLHTNSPSRTNVAVMSPEIFSLLF